MTIQSMDRNADPNVQAAKRKPKSERWDEMLVAAAEVFHEKSFAAASLQEIADRAGIPRGSFYTYIKHKEELRQQLLRDVHEERHAMLEAVLCIEESSLDRLRRMLDRHLDYDCENFAKTAFYREEIRGLDDDQRRAIFGQNYHPYRLSYEEVVRRAQGDGLILSELDPVMMVQMMLTSINALSDVIHVSPGKRGMARQFVWALLRGNATRRGIEALGAG